MAQKRTASEWAEIVKTYRESGKSQAAFCRENGINVKTLGNHIHGKQKRVQQQRSSKEWELLLREQQSSGLNLSEWCREHEVNENAMRGAERRLKTKQIKPAVPSWVELNVDISKKDTKSSEAEKGTILKIRMGGLELEAGAEYPSEKLSELLKELLRTC